jgi:4'-phosphopantetheinyl transferase
MVRLFGNREDLAAYYHVLSSDERSRSSSFAFEHLSTRFIFARGVLRLLAGSYLDVSPETVQFAYGPAGKPRIQTPSSDLMFNLSHSEDLAVYAFTRGCEIGVDVERQRSSPDLPQVAAHFFHPDELADLNALPETDRTAAFFRCWTRKEAYLKAHGGGLSIPLDSFRVSLGSDEAVPLLQRDSANAFTGCSVHGFVPAAGYVAALAYQGILRSLVFRPAATASQLRSSTSSKARP